MLRRRPLLLFIGPAGLYVTTLLVLAVFVLHPPTLGWIGLGVAAVLALAIAGVATRLLPRTRTNADRLHPHAGPVYRLLLVADGNPRPWRLRAAVQSRVRGRPHEVYVVAPVGASLLHFLTEDEGESQEAAQRRLESILRQLGEVGVAARGRVGTDDPLQAIGDALAFFPADEILVVDGEEAAGRWLDYRLEQQARDLFGVHVSGIRREIAA